MLSTAQPGYPWCTNWGLPTLFITGKCAESRRLLSSLADVVAVDLQVGSYPPVHVW